jgi:GNAT superfamily N-acetyltransferase
MVERSAEVVEGNEEQGYRIRVATEDDQNAIDSINSRAWGGGITTNELIERRHGLIDGVSWVDRGRRDITTHLALPNVTTFVAEIEGQVVGYASAQIKRQEGAADIGIVSYNAVDPDYRGRGIGTALMRRVESYLKGEGVRVLAVWTLEADEPARRMYERMGFEELTRFVYYSRKA